MAVLVSVACSADETIGPLGEPTATPSTACFRTDDGAVTRHVATFTPDEDLTLTEVELAGADNVEVIESVVLPFAGNPEVTGTFLRYPPGTGVIADSLMRWSDRRPLGGTGVEVGPDDGQLAILVGIALADPSADGRLDGVQLGYVDAAGADRARDYPGSLVLKASGASCTVTDFD